MTDQLEELLRRIRDRDEGEAALAEMEEALAKSGPEGAGAGGRPGEADGEDRPRPPEDGREDSRPIGERNWPDGKPEGGQAPRPGPTEAETRRQRPGGSESEDTGAAALWYGNSRAQTAGRRAAIPEAGEGGSAGNAGPEGTALPAMARETGADDRAPGADEKVRTEWTVRELYRQATRGAGQAEGAPPAVGRTAVTERMSTGAPSLTVDELDRAVRRDSRRYDGAMELY